MALYPELAVCSCRIIDNQPVDRRLRGHTSQHTWGQVALWSACDLKVQSWLMAASLAELLGV